DGTNLYAAGRFDKIGPTDYNGQPTGPDAKNIAMWNGTTWTNLGAGTYVKNEVSGYSDGRIAALAHDGTYLYAAGGFDRAGEVDAVGVARWNGSAWKTMGPGLGPQSAGGKTLDNYPSAMLFDGSSVIAGGGFTNAGGKAMLALSRWNGSTWLAYSNGPYNSAFGGWTSVRTLAHDGGSNLYVAGGFDYVGGSTYTYGGLARLNGTNWQSMSWSDLMVGSMACVGSNVFLGGGMTNHIAQWHGFNSVTYPGGGLPFYTNRSQTVGSLYGIGTNLYVLGTFINAGNIAGINGIAKWDGSMWTGLGSGTTQTVWAIASHSNDLYVGGRFDTIGGRAIKNIAKWYPALVSSNAVVPHAASYTGRYDVVILGTNLCNGDITNMTFCGLNVPLGDIASQTETQVVVRAPSTTNRTVGAIRIDSVSYGTTIRTNAFTYLYPGMKLLGTNGTPVAYGSSSVMSNGTDFGHILVGTTKPHRLRITNDGPIALQIFNVATNGAGKNAFTFSAIPAGIEAGAYSVLDVTFMPTNVGTFEVSLVISNDTLHSISNNVPVVFNFKGTSFARSIGGGPLAGGNLLTITNMNFGTITNVVIGGVSVGASNIVASGQNWFTIMLPASGSEGNRDIVVQTSDNGSTFLPGAYSYNPAGRIVRFVDGPLGWMNVGQGISNNVSALLSVGDSLYAGGSFGLADGQVANNVASWNGTAWSPLGYGLNSLVKSLAHDGTYLYAGGTFSQSGTEPLRYVGRWDGTNWTQVGSSNFNSAVDVVFYADSTLYAGGTFTSVGSTSVNYIARWDGSNWSAMGNGFGSGRVLAMTHDGTNLYVGGTFTNSGALAVNRVARWTGTAWTNLGVGVADTVSSLFFHEGTLYAGGSFSTAGGVTAQYVARWNGSTWTNTSSGGPWGSVYAFRHDGTNLYAGGGFSYAGANTNAKNVAAWSGTGWTNMSVGFNSGVNALELHQGRLYAGGAFSTSGNRAVRSVAYWGITQLETNGVIPNNGSWTGGYPVVIHGEYLGNGTDITNVTLGGTAAQITSQSTTQVVVTAGIAASAGLGDVRVYSVSFGETVQSSAFTYNAPGLQVRGTNHAVIASGAAASFTNGTRLLPTLPGQSRTHTLSVTNNGTEALVIDQSDLTDPSDVFSFTGIPATLSVGSVSNFTVTYTPTNVGSHTAALVISNNSP
ncbi:MAG TPA: hypothetical protein DCS43_06320, partial [Verrucomicrobia bacterium]|nr:hypothetical protein [Verrucomicrobiota bacterium]